MTPTGPYAVVLGTAQDGGLPQVGSQSEASRRARADASFGRLVAALLLAEPATGQRWLIDATPDFAEQAQRARPHPATRTAKGARPPLFDGIFLTHAHIGHYTGLMQLGREAYGAERAPVHATASMRAFLEKNGPWELLVRLGHIQLSTLAPDQPVALSHRLTLTPILVPHRGEYTDTVGFVARGPRRALLYIPDIDKWEKWQRPIEQVLAGVDVALLDGTFFADGELPGRSMADIPHPFIVESLSRLSALPESERRKVWFTHLNHTNPAVDPDSDAARQIAEAGMAVAEDGQLIEL